jgi:hypothetical protein
MIPLSCVRCSACQGPLEPIQLLVESPPETPDVKAEWFLTCVNPGCSFGPSVIRSLEEPPR